MGQKICYFGLGDRLVRLLHLKHLPKNVCQLLLGDLPVHGLLQHFSDYPGRHFLLVVAEHVHREFAFVLTAEELDHETYVLCESAFVFLAQNAVDEALDGLVVLGPHVSRSRERLLQFVDVDFAVEERELGLELVQFLTRQVWRVLQGGGE